jgi:hypothetical protein
MRTCDRYQGCMLLESYVAVPATLNPFRVVVLCFSPCVGTARYEIAAENKRLSEPLARALKEVEVLRAALASADKDKASLVQSKARLAAAEKQVRAGCGSNSSVRRVVHDVSFSWLLQCQVQFVCHVFTLPGHQVCVPDRWHAALFAAPSSCSTRMRCWPLPVGAPHVLIKLPCLCVYSGEEPGVGGGGAGAALCSCAG